MGTNYYILLNKCDCCGRIDRFHIGKKSIGWMFSFHGPMIAGERVRSWIAWKDIILRGQVIDEYDDGITRDEFFAIVERSRKERRNHFDACSEDFDDWEQRVKDGIDWKDDEGFSFCSGEFC